MSINSLWRSKDSLTSPINYFYFTSADTASTIFPNLPHASRYHPTMFQQKTFGVDADISASTTTIDADQPADDADFVLEEEWRPW